MNRKSLREQIFKLLFRVEFNDPAEMREQAQYFFDSGDMTVGERDQAYITDKCEKIIARIPEIDAELDDKLEDWSTARLGKVELAILRLGTYEILWDDAIPTGVAINEAVELAKKFGEDGSGSFVNGVLARIAGKKPSENRESARTRAKKSGEGVVSERKGETYITRRL